MMLEEEVRTCPSAIHTIHRKFPYMRHNVPVRFFKRKPGSKKEDYQWCSFCREVGRQNGKIAKEKRDKLVAEQLELVEAGKSDVMYCPDACHGGACKSEFPRNRVPIDQFRRHPGKEDSELYVNCEDCRTYASSMNLKLRHDVIATAKEENRCLCVRCCADITDCRVVSFRGTISTMCEKCRKNSREESAKAKRLYNNIKLQRIKHHQVSCMRCQCLYFSPKTEDSLAVQCVKTYLKGNVRYCTIDNVEYKAAEIIEKREHLLEIGIIEMDHLTMQEQLEAGIIACAADYKPKIRSVSSMSQVRGVEREAVKCQHLCSKCHLITSIEREKGAETHVISAKKKLAYVRSLKAEGCSSCGYRDITLPRFFDMDHTSVKRANISEMCYDPKYTLQDVIDECRLCRVLCKFCHRIHTRRQINAGIRIEKAQPKAAEQSL
jgi:hypothetical protein